jgi:hypothetical protein
MGLGYFSPLGNSITLTLGREKAKGKDPYPVVVLGQTVDLRTNRVDDSVALAFNYALSPLVRLSSRLAYTRRTDHRPVPAGFKGLVGDINLVYAPRDGLSFKLHAARQLSSQSYLFVDGQKTDLFEGEAKTSIARRVAVKLNAAYTNQNLAFNSLADNGPGGHNRLLRFGAELSTQLGEIIRLGLAGGHELRFGGGVYQPFTENSLRLNFTYGFGGEACSLLTC